MKLVTFMTPVLLCAAISFGALLGGIVKSRYSQYTESLFFAFLPGCFLLMAGLLLRMNRDVSRLRRRIARLEGRVLPGSPAGDSSDASRGPADAAHTHGEPHGP